MAINKRFTDRNKWQDAWFLSLSPVHKLLWLFLIENCDGSGVWPVSRKYAEFVIGAPVNWEESLKVFNGRVIVHQDKWFIPKFLIFQYPNGITDDSTFTNSVIKLLRHHQLLNKVIQLYGKSFIRVSKDLTKSKPTDKDKGKEKEVSMYIDVFNELWTQYPKKIDKTKALQHFSASVKSDDDVTNIKKALENYLQYIDEEVTNDKYIKHAKTWFNNWKDWVEWTSEKPQRRML